MSPTSYRAAPPRGDSRTVADPSHQVNRPRSSLLLKQGHGLARLLAGHGRVAGFAGRRGLVHQLDGTLLLGRRGVTVLHGLVARRLAVLVTRGLDVLVARWLDVLGARRLDVLVAWRLHVLIPRRLDILVARRLDVLVAWRLNVLVPRRLDIL